MSEVPYDVEREFLLLKEEIMKQADISEEDHKILNMTLDDYYNVYYEGDYEDINYSKDSSLFILKRNQVAMMETRGFIIPEHEMNIPEMDLKQFEEYLAYEKRNSYWSQISNEFRFDKKYQIDMEGDRCHLSNYYEHEDDARIKCIVLYIDIAKGKIGEMVIKPMLNFLTEGGFRDIIFITGKPFSKRGLNMISNISPVVFGSDRRKDVFSRFIQIFSDQELYVNPLENSLVPLHELLSREEKNELLKKYSEIPRISIEDPVVKFYGWRLGNVVKITRDISSIMSSSEIMIIKRLIVRDSQVDLASLRNFK